MSKLKYIVAAVYVTGLLASQYCAAEPLGPFLLLFAAATGLAGAVAAGIKRRWQEIAPLLVLGVLGCGSLPPLLDRCRFIPNDSAAITQLRALATAQVTYKHSNTAYGTPEQLIEAGLLDAKFGTMAGYRFSVLVTDGGMSYVAKATRVALNTGDYEYYILPDAEVRYSPSAAPGGAAGQPVR